MPIERCHKLLYLSPFKLGRRVGSSHSWYVQTHRSVALAAEGNFKDEGYILFISIIVFIIKEEDYVHYRQPMLALPTTLIFVPSWYLLFLSTKFNQSIVMLYWCGLPSTQRYLLCGRCLLDPPCWQSLTFVSHYHPPISTLIKKMKFDGVTQLAPILALLLLFAGYRKSIMDQ